MRDMPNHLIEVWVSCTAISLYGGRQLQSEFVANLYPSPQAGFRKSDFIPNSHFVNESRVKPQTTSRTTREVSQPEISAFLCGGTYSQRVNAAVDVQQNVSLVQITPAVVSGNCKAKMQLVHLRAASAVGLPLPT
jgi:hypothetical protein